MALPALVTESSNSGRKLGLTFMSRHGVTYHVAAGWYHRSRREEDAVAFGHDPKNVAEYMLWSGRQDGDPLTPMQVLKLVYIAHGWNLGLTGRPLINEDVEAWKYGPVVPSVYHEFKRFGGAFITDCPTQQPQGFLPVEISIMHQVWKGYGKRSGVSLSSLTHQPGTPWDITIKRLGQGAVIPNDLIEEHYRSLSKSRA